jgi:hypothetical protein
MASCPTNDHTRPQTKPRRSARGAAEITEACALAATNVASAPPMSKREMRRRLRDAGAFARDLTQVVEGLDPWLVRCSAWLVAKSLLVATLIHRLDTLPIRELLDLVRSLDPPADPDAQPRGRSRRKSGILPPEFPDIVRDIYGVDIDAGPKPPAGQTPSEASGTAERSAMAPQPRS